jgi:hypothetical protein
VTEYSDDDRVAVLRPMIEAEDEGDAADDAFGDAFAAVRDRAGGGSGTMLRDLERHEYVALAREPAGETGNDTRSIVIGRVAHVTAAGRAFVRSRSV